MLSLANSDIHFGNAIVHSDLNTVYPIDRNLYLQFSGKDAAFIRDLVTSTNEASGARILSMIIDYFQSLPENKEVAGKVFSKQSLMVKIGIEIR